LPFRIREPRFVVGRTLGVMDPAKDILRGANRHMFAVGGCVTLTGADGAGIAVCPLDHPLVSLDTPGCWKFSLDHIPKKPIVYLNLYNNQWNTNYRYWYPGTWSSRVRVWTVDKAATIHDALVRSLEARHPLLAARAEGNGGELPAERTGLAVSRRGVTVTAFHEDCAESRGILLRVWEQAGVSGDLTLTLPARMKFTTATPVNLRGEKVQAPTTVKGGELSFKLNAYAPASFILE
jgi:alpha-mannosidase